MIAQAKMNEKMIEVRKRRDGMLGRAATWLLDRPKLWQHREDVNTLRNQVSLLHEGVKYEDVGGFPTYIKLICLAKELGWKDPVWK